MEGSIRILSQLCANDIFSVKSTDQADIKAWLANQSYLLDSELQSSNGTRAVEFSLSVKDLSSFHVGLANDCNRFAQAAIESMWLINKNERLPKSAGWASVQMYYSSFYAAHAILRLFGWSCNQLEKTHVDKVFELALATSMVNGVTSIEHGFYLGRKQGSIVFYKKLKDSHADTWYSLSQLFTWLINNLDSKSTGLGKHKSEAQELLSDLKAVLVKSGAHRGNWPSQIRNKVHYQHTHGVWFPYKGAVHDQNVVLSNSEWLKPVKPSLSFNKKDDISTLFYVSNKLLSLMFNIMKYNYERSGKVAVPFTNGTFRLFNQLSVA